MMVEKRAILASKVTVTGANQKQLQYHESIKVGRTANEITTKANEKSIRTDVLKFESHAGNSTDEAKTLESEVIRNSNATYSSLLTTLKNWRQL